MRALGMVCVLLPCLAQAASFDCKAARTLREKAICADPVLSVADETLAAAYAAARDKASDATKAMLRSQQLAWLKQTNLVCTDGRTDPSDKDLRSCLKLDIDGREQFLARAIRQFGAYRFVQSWQSTAERDPDAPETPDPAFGRFGTQESDWPQMEVPSAPANSAFNAWATRRFAPDGARKPDPSEDTTSSAQVASASDRVIRVVWDFYEYGHGAAHGNPGTLTLTWLVAEQRELRAADIFAAPGWQKALTAKLRAVFAEQFDGEQPTDTAEEMQKIVVDPQRWQFSSTSFGVQFEPYEVAPYSAGAPVVTLKWAQIEPLLAKGSPVLAALRQ